jgi:hypothetical protein
MGSKLATGNSLILGDLVRADNWFENRPFFMTNAGFWVGEIKSRQQHILARQRGSLLDRLEECYKL